MMIYQDMLSSNGLRGALYRAIKVDVKGEKQARKLIDKMMGTEKYSIRFQLIRMNAKRFRAHFQNDIL